MFLFADPVTCRSCDGLMEKENLVPRSNLLLAVSLTASASIVVAEPVLNAQELKGPVTAAQPAGPPEPVANVEAAEARAAALRLADLLDENYADPAIATRYAAALRKKASQAGYDAAGTRSALAAALTADLRDVSEDKHLRVLLAPSKPGSGGPGTSGPPNIPQAVEEPRWLAPGVAYVRLNLFPGKPEGVEAARRFMTEHADARTMIFDLRNHRGGGLAEMDVIFPYLFERPTRLLAMDTRGSVARASKAPPNMGLTLRTVPAEGDIVRREHVVVPHPTERRLFNARVFVLTSEMTFSAAEHFTLALRRTGRATLIGEPTGGGGNFGGMREIGSGLAAFIPIGTTRDPETGARWDGNGIEPHVRVKAEEALVEALVRSGIAPLEAKRISATVRATGPMRRKQTS